MAKTHRGTGIRELVNSSRGECPKCKRTGVKLLYEVENGENKINVCKACSSSIKNKK